MAGKNWQVLWSPHSPDKFIRYSNDITLYRLLDNQQEPPGRQGGTKQVVKLGDDTYATVVAVNSEISSIKAVSWCLKPDADNIIAVGQSNGHVTVTGLGQNHNSSTNSGLSIGKEFVPKADRPCAALSWNPAEQNLLAVGLDKVRNDFSLIIWDVETKPHGSFATGFDARPSFEGPSFVRPVYELGISESTVSLAWLPAQPYSIVAGQGQKFLRVFDLREPSRPQLVAVTKALNGVSVDPLNSQRIATFTEGAQGAVVIWDIRSFDKPLMSINQTRALSSLSWCPTRPHLLAALPKSSSVIKLFDLQHTAIGNPVPYVMGVEEENEVMHTERTIQCFKSTVSSFSWHPRIENSLLAAGVQGNMSYISIYERIALSWSSDLSLAWGCGRQLVFCSEKEEISDPLLHDISLKMKERAIRGYGEKSLMKDNVKLQSILGDTELAKMWNWIRKFVRLELEVRSSCRCSEINERTKAVRRPKNTESKKMRKFFGVKSILNNEANPSVYRMKFKEIMQESVEGGKCDRSQPEENPKSPVLVTTPYFSDDRKLALQLCGWDFEPHNILEHLNKNENGECQKERAAAIAIFNNQMRTAIDILSEGSRGRTLATKGTDTSLEVVAMALAGYSEDRKTLWREMCSSLGSKLTNPYLRAIFAFLTKDEDDYGSVLRETEMALVDRVAFACKYLSDSRLASYIEGITSAMIESGNLQGLLLTGLMPDGLNLLERYVTKTSDVQTASLIIVNTKITDILKDTRVNCWLESYRDLLDIWRLWHQRAQLDAFVYAHDPGRKTFSQICVGCNFCSQRVNDNYSTSGMSRSFRFHKALSGRPKVMSCPNCRKPLPRCSICLINMGTASSQLQKSGSKINLDSHANPFNNWMTWCQDCRHGGHAVHLVEWFRTHTVCPVSGCLCRCNELDGVTKVTGDQTTNSSDGPT